MLQLSMCNFSTVCVSLAEPYSSVCTSHAVVLLNWREDGYTVRTLCTVKYSWTLSSWWSKITCHTKYDVLMNTPLSIWQHYPVAVCIWYTWTGESTECKCTLHMWMCTSMEHARLMWVQYIPGNTSGLYIKNRMVLWWGSQLIGLGTLEVDTL